MPFSASGAILTVHACDQHCIPNKDDKHTFQSGQPVFSIHSDLMTVPIITLIFCFRLLTNHDLMTDLIAIPP